MFREREWPTEPFIFQMKTCDIPETMIKTFRNLKRVAPACRGVALYPVTTRINKMLEQFAKECDMCILWLKPGPWAKGEHLYFALDEKD